MRAGQKGVEAVVVIIGGGTAAAATATATARTCCTRCTGIDAGGILVRAEERVEIVRTSSTACTAIPGISSCRRRRPWRWSAEGARRWHMRTAGSWNMMLMADDGSKRYGHSDARAGDYQGCQAEAAATASGWHRRHCYSKWKDNLREDTCKGDLSTFAWYLCLESDLLGRKWRASSFLWFVRRRLSLLSARVCLQTSRHSHGDRRIISRWSGGRSPSKATQPARLPQHPDNVACNTLEHLNNLSVASVN